MAESYSQIKSVAIFGSIHKQGFCNAASELITALKKYGVEINIDIKVYNFLNSEIPAVLDGCDVVDDKKLLNTDLVMSLGGDGTFLKTAMSVGAIELPILGINLGHLGFLVDIKGDEITSAIDEVFKNGFCTDSRSLIEFNSDDVPDIKNQVALNEVGVLKPDTSSMIRVNACVDGEFLCTYRADGLLVSTPTGSTAYAMSVGASIVDPECSCILLAPVSPHTLNQRPIILPDNKTIELEVVGRSKDFIVSFDGHCLRCPMGAKITVRKAKFSVLVAKRKGHTYFQTLREKLLWGQVN